MRRRNGSDNGGPAVRRPGERCALPLRGFTLLELLVVVTVIGMLVALLAPAIQAAREAARRAECKNNLKQLSLAALNHLDMQGHFPTGGWGWYWVGDPDRGFGKDQPGGWIYNLLPYCEESPGLHDLAADGKPNEIGRVQSVGAAQVIQSPLVIVSCPTRRRATVHPLVANEWGELGFYNSITPDVAAAATTLPIPATSIASGPTLSWDEDRKATAMRNFGRPIRSGEVSRRNCSSQLPPALKR